MYLLEYHIEYAIWMMHNFIYLLISKFHKMEYRYKMRVQSASLTSDLFWATLKCKKYKFQEYILLRSVNFWISDLISIKILTRSKISEIRFDKYNIFIWFFTVAGNWWVYQKFMTLPCIGLCSDKSHHACRFKKIVFSQQFLLLMSYFAAMRTFMVLTEFQLKNSLKG